MFGMMGWMGFGMVFWLALLVVAAYIVIRLFRNHGGDNAAALNVLKQRYARGDIDKDTFDRMKNELR